ncbi:DnaJ protein-like protein xdj1 [Golovinomyces cichoracearum]|uniref:DnaJ protein-like protein xdj1 n=1 Tax=Golovinomyces cichoracearum TaxID=62708 RepID=A0A420HKM1_9PEZI|nr:DnaJ protein-like protein xdj1 [Golovinomyces cichoracearum]
MNAFQNPEVDLYSVLGISSSATKTEIKKAYHKAALQHHPDKVSEEHKEESEKTFKEISRAYEILHDEEKRRLYDMHGMAAFDQSRTMETEVDLEEVLRFFGMHDDMPSSFTEQGRTQGSKKGPNEEQTYQVTLEDLYKGKTVKFASTKNIICSHCKGSGGKEKAKPVNCEKCKGSGVVVGLRSVGPGLVTQDKTTCSNCKGSGKHFKERDRCKKCKGKRTTSEKKVLEIYIPTGSRSGERIVLEGEADQVPNQIPGDIVFTLSQDDHEIFKRHGDHLSAVINITLTEALTGFNRVVLKHLDGRGIQINHPAGKIMRPGQTLKVKGEGMPLKKSDVKGDLYLTVKVNFPEDEWAKSPASLIAIRKYIPQPTPLIKVPEIDEVNYESNADLNEIQSGEWESSDDEEDDDEEQSAQCAQQ